MAKMLGNASFISLSSSHSIYVLFPLQISPQYQTLKTPKRNLAKLLSYTTKQTLQSNTHNTHNLRLHPSVHPTNLYLLGNPPNFHTNSNLSTIEEEIQAPKSSINAEAEEEEKEDDYLEYYEPRIGDHVAGVVVSRIDNRLEINIGSKSPAFMYLNEFFPLNHSETNRILCEMPTDRNTDENLASASADYSYNLFANGRMGILMDKGAATADNGIIEEGTIVHAEVLGRALSGEPLLSSRRFVRKIAWQRIRQIKEENEPIEIYISEWNTGGLISRIEGLRVFLPKGQMLNTPSNKFAALKEYVGTNMDVVIINVNESVGDLIVSERKAWEMRNFYEGNLLQGTIKRLYEYGARVMIDGTRISCLLHISNISCANVPSASAVFSKGEKVKVMVVRSNFPNIPSLSTADLESEKGLILSNKEKVFVEAEQIAAAYRSKSRYLWRMHERKVNAYDAHTHANNNENYANWDWFKFEPDHY